MYVLLKEKQTILLQPSHNYSVPNKTNLKCDFKFTSKATLHLHGGIVHMQIVFTWKDMKFPCDMCP